MMDNWHTVGTRDEVETEMPLAAQIGETKIGVYEVNGALYAIDDVCPHAYAMLTQGFAEGCEVECPLHNAVFDVTTGKHLRGEPCADVRTYPVRLAGQDIQVQVVNG